MRLIFALLILPALAACSAATQTSSGSAFLSARSAHIDPDVARAAAVEPDLHFPARIGIARIVNRELTLPPETELGIIDAPQGLGSYTVVNPLITETLDVSPRGNPIRAAQLTAARQHQDYVLIYEMTQTGRGFGKSGLANAMLMDVRTGYVYGTASVSKNLGAYNGIWLGWGRGYGLSGPAAAKMAGALAPEIVQMLTDLRQRAQMRR